MQPLRALLLTAAIPLLAAHAAYAQPAAPVGVPMLEHACDVDPVPPAFDCVQATVTGPKEKQVFTFETGAMFRMDIVAELRSTVIAYVLYPKASPSDPDRVFSGPYVRRASELGNAHVEVSLANFPAGDYRAAAFYLASREDEKRDDSFYQITGTPPVPFSVFVPPPVTPPVVDPPYVPPERPPGTPPVTRMECGMTEIWETDGITYGRRDDSYQGTGRGNSIYVMQKLADGGSPAAQAAREALMRDAISQLAYDVCSAPTKEEGVEGLTAAMRRAFDGYHGFGAFPDRQLWMPQAEIRSQALALADPCPADPSSLRRDVPDLIGVFVNRLSFGNTPVSEACEECDGYKICYASGNSPLVFLSTDRPVEARVDVRVPGGRVSERRPEMAPDGWRASVRPDATTLPLYYEFTAPLPALPSEGWSVATADLHGFLRAELASWGYPADEVEAFLRTDVAPKLPEAPFTQVRVYAREDVDRMLPLEVTPAPDRVDRVLFHLQPSPQDADLVPPAAQRRAGVAGFTVRELGAVIGR